jgi:hypothetical protein
MAVHIFVVDEKNYEICIRKGLAAVPNGNKAHINDALISRMAMIRKDDYVLFYITVAKELRGVYKVLELPFFDDTVVWKPTEKGQIYPFRIRIDNTIYSFVNPIFLSDIHDLKDQGLIWTFSLHRNMYASNALFSISDAEFNHLLNLFLKKNPINHDPQQIREPYPYFKPNILEKLTFSDNHEPKFESTLMSLILSRLAKGDFKDKFGNFSDYLAYVPTSFEKEIDILLTTRNPIEIGKNLSYNILELKRDKFDAKGLKQLLQYEVWFLNKKVNGDFNMLQTTAIAKSFDDDVLDYLKKRKLFESKIVTLLQFENINNNLTLKGVEY